MRVYPTRRSPATERGCGTASIRLACDKKEKNKTDGFACFASHGRNAQRVGGKRAYVLLALRRCFSHAHTTCAVGPARCVADHTGITEAACGRTTHRLHANHFLSRDFVCCFIFAYLFEWKLGLGVPHQRGMEATPAQRCAFAPRAHAFPTAHRVGTARA